MKKNLFYFLGIIAMTIFVAFVTMSAKDKEPPTFKQLPPNPAKEYPQENYYLIDVKNLPGNTIKHMKRNELYEYMDAIGFRRLDKKNLHELRRIYIAYSYDDFFYTMHKKTDLPVSVIYAFFVIEATSNGLESKLMTKALNPGGIKYTGRGKKMKSYDDCYIGSKKVPCDFQAYSNYQAMVDGWSRVMNLPRYKNCKRYVYAKYNRGMQPKDIVNNICKCFWKSGYHTSNAWKVRSDISTDYWTVKTSFPILEF
jgi:hypothetical protein